MKQAGGSFRKQENVLKSINKTNFINMLAGKQAVEEPKSKRSRVEQEDEDIKEEEQEEGKQSTWNILR